MEGFAALEHLGDSYVDDDPVLAEDYCCRLLVDNPDLKSTTATQHIKLAELLIRRGDKQDLEEAEELLLQWSNVARVPFPNANFRWNLAVVALAEAIGTSAQQWKQRAEHSTSLIERLYSRDTKRLASFTRTTMPLSD